MPHLYPSDPRFPDDGGAERAVWQQLVDQLPDGAALFHGLRLLDESHEREIDLLVAWPGVGIAVIEVKGGHISRTDGAWYQGNANDRHRIDPVGQVQAARHILTRLLTRWGVGARSARIAHLVTFPHVFVPADWQIPEAPRDTIVDRGDLTKVAFIVKRAIENHGVGDGFLTDDAALDELVVALTGRFMSQAEHLALAAQHEDRIDQLTRDQARQFEHLRQFRRLRVVGGAGSGKTWMALEQTRRLVRDGERVALVCYSRGLGRYLQRVTGQWPGTKRPAFVGPFLDLPLSWGAEPGADDDSDYWERRLPERLGELASERPSADLFDSIVVDEAQDFSATWWPPLIGCLRDPDHGGLFVFSDDSQRVFAREGAAPIDLPPVTFDENLRSTKQIAQLFGAFTDVRVNPRGEAGSPVRVVDVTFEEALGAADDAVDALLAEGWQPGQIALLTTGARHPIQVDVVERRGHDRYWDDFFAETDVFYGHVLGFKGLERTVVVLAVNGFRELERARTMLYTGLSRARLLLVVVGPRDEIERLGGKSAHHRLGAAEVWVPAP